LVDTNTLSELAKKQPDTTVLNFLTSIPEDSLYISVVSLGEIKKGIEKTTDTAKKKRLEMFFNQIRELFDGRIVDIDESIMLEWGRLVATHPRTLPAIDSLLAATCLHRDFSLITRNTKDFADIAGLRVFNPWKDAPAF
jgi:predicted nucleic acid-binding protein